MPRPRRGRGVVLAFAQDAPLFSSRKSSSTSRSRDVVISLDYRKTALGDEPRTRKVAETLAKYFHQQGMSCYFDDNQRKNWKAGFLGEIKKAKAAVVLMTPGYTECKECRTELVQIFNHLNPLNVFVVSVEETSLQGNFLGTRAGQVQDAAYVLARMANDVYPSVGVFTDTMKNKAELFGMVDERLSAAGMDSGERLYATVYALLTCPPPFCAMGGKIDFVYLIATRHSGDQVHKAKKTAAPSFLFYCFRQQVH